MNPKFVIPKIVRDNILFLVNYMKPRDYYGDLIPEIKQRLEFFQFMEIDRLAKSFEPKVDYRIILPLIVHLIATGVLNVNISKKINPTCQVSLGTIFNEVSLLFEKE